MIKHYLLKPLLYLLLLLVLLSFSVMTLLFFKPGWLINEITVEYFLNQSGIFKEWSWQNADINFKWKKWNVRRLQGQIKEFCFLYDRPKVLVKTCLTKALWDVDLAWTFSDGFEMRPRRPFNFSSRRLIVRTKNTDAPKKTTKPPQIWKTWNKLWADWFPPLNVDIDLVQLSTPKKTYEFSFEASKSKERLTLKALGFHLEATPKLITLTSDKKFQFAKQLPTKKALALENFKLTAIMQEKGIPLRVTGDLDGFDLVAESYIDLPLKMSPTSVSFRKDLLLKTSAEIVINDVKEVIHTYVPAPYDKLPAPLNVMNGQMALNFSSSNIEDSESILINSLLRIDLRGEKQVLDMEISADVPINTSDFSRGVTKLGINFSQVAIQLPRLSRKSRPPQFMPDKRFKSLQPELKKQAQEEPRPRPDLSFELTALNDQALHILTNLLEDPLRLNFHLLVRQAQIKNGFIKVLPFQTTIFKRPIRLRELFIRFNHPSAPLIEGVVQFPLPEYKITMMLEGPLSDPQYVFTSRPPLPQRDIAAVLLFGRPLEELGAEDQSAARQTNQILAQGILSLSVLYFLAGSPVEYIGYDPETKRATAQIGLGRRSSFRIGGGQGGGVAGVRRTLGKGWYLDTSLQNQNPANRSGQNFGVLLERIMTY